MAHIIRLFVAITISLSLGALLTAMGFDPDDWRNRLCHFLLLAATWFLLARPLLESALAHND